MKKIAILVIAIGIALATGSCGGKTQQVPFDDGDSISQLQADPTVYGICGVETTMNSLQMITDTGDTLTFDLSIANEKGQVFGGMQVGDRMAVVPDTLSNALIVINQTTLLGDWIMPIDGSDEVGIRIKEGGIAESINQSTIVYRTWRLTRGMLEIVSTREDVGVEDEVNLYRLQKLNGDSLVYGDDEDVFEYGHHKADANYGVDIKLEDAEDFKI